MEEVLIGIEQSRRGLEEFIGVWLCEGEYNVIFDVGPANTAGRLIESLEQLGIKKLDYVFITHIHIDHAGALAQVLNHFPGAKAICFNKGIDHIVDPGKLWQGSLKVLGDLAEVYGAPKPVKVERIIPHNEFKMKDLQIIETPGHAPHHLSFSYKGRLFSGEAAGNYLMVNGKDYLRPATPPRFFLDTFLSSVDRLLSLTDQPICYAHFGKAQSSHRQLNRFREQILFWKELIGEEMGRGDDGIVDRCVERLIREDKNLEAFFEMDQYCQERERTFVANAVKGFVGYFREKS